MMSCPESNKELNKVLINTPECLPLQEHQQFDSVLNKARLEIISLHQKLCHARKNLEDEKRKRRSVERYRNALEGHINMAIEVLFHDRRTNLNETVKEKLQFLNQYMIEIKYNNPCIKNKQNEGQLAAITETDSTGSILSDLNCLSKSEDDLDTNAIIKVQNQVEYKEHKPSDECSANKQCSTLDKVIEFNLPDRLATVGVVPKGETCATASENQVASSKGSVISINPKSLTPEALTHTFMSRIIIKPEKCILCDGKIKFGRRVRRCIDCHIICHSECKTKFLQCPDRDSKLAMLCKVST
ncbi:Rac GTPase-activating protein [Ooceraea biroi]|uniref:Rac GTPase-activating protein n=1 Tax=Ooceraea biroi TaxID=2015173 RepID=A0A026X578_OOCBI|nr:Rac GTPase-activating protein [Ooceraea biroi]